MHTAIATINSPFVILFIPIEHYMYLKFYFIVNVEMIFARIYKNKFESEFSMVNNRCYIFDHIYPGLVVSGLEK